MLTAFSSSEGFQPTFLGDLLQLRLFFLLTNVFLRVYCLQFGYCSVLQKGLEMKWNRIFTVSCLWRLCLKLCGFKSMCACVFAVTVEFRAVKPRYCCHHFVEWCDLRLRCVLCVCECSNNTCLQCLSSTRNVYFLNFTVTPWFFSKKLFSFFWHMQAFPSICSIQECYCQAFFVWNSGSFICCIYFPLVEQFLLAPIYFMP